MGIVLLLLLAWLVYPTEMKEQAISEEPSCDFSGYKPLRVDHALLPDSLIKKQQPQYPKIAKEAKVEGEVHIKILVDRSGNVHRACVIKGHPLLNPSAREAALGFKFKKHFGGSRNSIRDARYAETRISFNFTLTQ